MQSFGRYCEELPKNRSDARIFVTKEKSPKAEPKAAPKAEAKAAPAPAVANGDDLDAQIAALGNSECKVRKKRETDRGEREEQ